MKEVQKNYEKGDMTDGLKVGEGMGPSNYFVIIS